MTIPKNLELEVLKWWQEMQKEDLPTEHFIKMISALVSSFGSIARIGQLPVVIEYAGQDDIGKWDYGSLDIQVPRKTRYEETIADKVFTYTQLKAVYNSLREVEIPQRILLKHYEETVYRCDEWIDRCDITIALELTSGASFILCENNGSFWGFQDCHQYGHYHNYKLKRKE